MKKLGTFSLYLCINHKLVKQMFFYVLIQEASAILWFYRLKLLLQ